MNFKSTRAAVLIGTLLVIFLGSVVASIQDETIGKDAILAALKELQRGDSQDFLIDRISQQGVDFQLSEETKRELTRAGATPKLINAIRANYRAIPSPTPTPTPRSTPTPTPTPEFTPSPTPEPELSPTPRPPSHRRTPHAIFAGTWTEDKARSEGVSTRYTAILEIKQDDKEVSISSVAVDPDNPSRTDFSNPRVRIYSLDGRKLVTQTGNRTEVRSVMWSHDGKILEVLTVTTTSTPNGDVTANLKEMLSLSEDGNMLTISSHIDSPRGPRDSKQVFTRQVRNRSRG